MEHQASHRVNLLADSVLERNAAYYYYESMLKDHYIEHVPNNIVQGLDRYRNEHIPTGNFLESVLTNNLYRAIASADPFSLYALPAIVKYIDNNFPLSIYGSQDKYDKWINR